VLLKDWDFVGSRVTDVRETDVVAEMLMVSVRVLVPRVEDWDVVLDIDNELFEGVMTREEDAVSECSDLVSDSVGDRVSDKLSEVVNVLVDDTVDVCDGVTDGVAVALAVRDWVAVSFSVGVGVGGGVTVLLRVSEGEAERVTVWVSELDDESLPETDTTSGDRVIDEDACWVDDVDPEPLPETEVVKLIDDERDDERSSVSVPVNDIELESWTVLERLSDDDWDATWVGLKVREGVGGGVIVFDIVLECVCEALTSNEDDAECVTLGISPEIVWVSDWLWLEVMLKLRVALLLAVGVWISVFVFVAVASFDWDWVSDDVPEIDEVCETERASVSDSEYDWDALEEVE
jgi:hypothetical protein